MKKSTFIVLALFLNISSTPIFAEDVDVAIKFIENFTSNENVTSVLNVRSLWSERDKIYFATRINSSVQFINELHSVRLGEFLNNVVFFINMNHMGSTTFLLNVIKMLRRKG